MCYKESIVYCCGHESFHVARACPLTTQRHNYPVCEIQHRYQYDAKTMCPACERVLHSRWTLVQEWEHRWYHQRGVCDCPVIFPDLSSRPRVIGASLDNSERSDDDQTLGGSPQLCIENKGVLDVQGGSPIKMEGDYNPEQAAVTGPLGQEVAKRAVTIGGKEGHGPQDHIPPLYQETTAEDQRNGINKTHVTVRQASQYAAEWLEDHRALHALGRCSCSLETKPIVNPIIKEQMTKEEQKILQMHRSITGDAPDTDKENPLSEEEIARLREETGMPELGTVPEWTVTRYSAPDTTKYPLPLSPNTYLRDENTIVWDKALLESQAADMQTAGSPNGPSTKQLGNMQIACNQGTASSPCVVNGSHPAPRDFTYVYQPSVSTPSQEPRKKGGRRRSQRDMLRRDSIQRSSHGHPGLHGNALLWQQQTGQDDYGAPFAPMQQPVSNIHYEMNPSAQFFNPPQHAVQYATPDCAGFQPQLLQYPQNNTTSRRSLWEPEQSTPSGGNSNASKAQNKQRVQKSPSNMIVSAADSQAQRQEVQSGRITNVTVPQYGPTPPLSAEKPNQQAKTTPVAIIDEDDECYVAGWYISPPNTHNKGVNGNSAIASPDPTPTRTVQNPEKQIVLPAAASPNPSPTKVVSKEAKDAKDAKHLSSEPASSSLVPIKNSQKLEPRQPTSSDTASSAVTPSKTGPKRISRGARKRRQREKTEKAEEEKKRGTLLCGLPIGAGPEGGKNLHMREFAACSLFRKAYSEHKRSCSA